MKRTYAFMWTHAVSRSVSVDGRPAADDLTFITEHDCLAWVSNDTRCQIYASKAHAWWSDGLHCFNYASIMPNLSVRRLYSAASLPEDQKRSTSTT